VAWQKLENYFAEAKRKGYALTEDSPLFIAYKGHFSKEEKKLAVKPKKIRVMTQGAINQVYDNASLSTWKDLELKRFSPQDFRDFVQSQLENADINANIIAPIMAHKPKSAVDFHYSSHLWQELLAKYKQALAYLLPISVEKLKTETDQLKTDNDRLIKEQQKQIEEIRERLMKYLSYLPLTVEEKEKALNKAKEAEIVSKT
jgi:hypothetical protein